MPVDMKRYPPNYKTISRARKEAAGWKCEWCRAPHGEVVTRVPGGFYAVVEQDAEDSTEEIVWRDKRGCEMTVEAIAYILRVPLDYGPEGQLLPECRIWTSKVVLACVHLAEDLADHIAHARQTRMKRKAAASLFEDFEGTDFATHSNANR